jgi:hypothetical protein
VIRPRQPTVVCIDARRRVQPRQFPRSTIGPAKHSATAFQRFQIPNGFSNCLSSAIEGESAAIEVRIEAEAFRNFGAPGDSPSANATGGTLQGMGGVVPPLGSNSILQSCEIPWPMYNEQIEHLLLEFAAAERKAREIAQIDRLGAAFWARSPAAVVAHQLVLLVLCERRANLCVKLHRSPFPSHWLLLEPSSPLPYRRNFALLGKLRGDLISRLAQRT